MDNRELHVGKDFEDKIINGELTAKDIKNYIKEEQLNSLIFPDNTTTIHVNPLFENDIYVWGEGDVIDGIGDSYWEMDLCDYLHIKKYNKAVIGIKDLLKEKFLTGDFKPEKHELLKEKFEIISYNEKSEMLKYTFYVQQESKLFIYQYTYDSTLKDEQGIKHDIIETDIKELYSLFK